MLLKLLEGADVLVENFKPGWDGEMGSRLRGRDLAPNFPSLIHCRVSGERNGPLGGLPGYDAILQAMTGLMSINGDPTTGPMRMGTPIVDIGTGLYSVIAILMALHERFEIRPRPVLRHDAARLRHGPAAPAGGQFLPQRQTPDADGQPAAEPGAV